MAWHLILMAVIYIAAGINHFIKPKIYVRIIPDYLPAHAFLVYLSGIFEIALGIMLFWKNLRPFAIWGIILMLIVFLPFTFTCYDQKRQLPVYQNGC